MKKIIGIIGLAFLAIFTTIKGQENFVDFSDRFVDDYNCMIDIKDEKHFDKWSNSIHKLGHYDANGNIFYQYVFQGGQEYNYTIAKALIEFWLDHKEEGRFLTKRVDNKNDKTLTTKGLVKLDFIASTTCGLTYAHMLKVKQYIHSWANVIVEFREDRIRITVSVSEYDVSYDVPNGGDEVPSNFQNHKPSIRKEPPFEWDTNKKSWLEAYVRTNECCRKMIFTLVSFLNESYQLYKEKTRMEEKRQNEEW